MSVASVLTTLVILIVAMVCNSGTYSSEGPDCPNVCGLKADRCSSTGVDGCVCGAGQWKEGDTCVDSSVCGCSDGLTGEYYKVSIL